MRLVEVTVSTIAVQHVHQGGSGIAQALSQAPWYSTPLLTFLCPAAEVKLQLMRRMDECIGNGKAFTVSTRDVDIDDNYIAPEYRP